MTRWQLGCVAAAFAASPLSLIIVAKITTDLSNAAADADVTERSPSSLMLSSAAATFSQRYSLLLHEEEAVVDNANGKQAKVEEEDFSFQDHSAAALPPEPHLSYLAYYPYAELPPNKRPADIVLDSLKNIPVGTPIEEIKRAADAFGLDFSFMKAVAKIESDFDPKQRTGSYIGLFQLSKYEFNTFGSGQIVVP